MYMDDFAKLTLELFMNKNAYNRYMEQTDPIKHNEHQEYIKNMQKYKMHILDITRRFIEDPDLQITCEMNDMFSDYCKTCIKYFELKDLEDSCVYDNKKNAKDEDTMFDDIDNSSTIVHAEMPLLDSKYRENAPKAKAKYTLDSFIYYKNMKNNRSSFL